MHLHRWPASALERSGPGDTARRWMVASDAAKRCIVASDIPQGGVAWLQTQHYGVRQARYTCQGGVLRRQRPQGCALSLRVHRKACVVSSGDRTRGVCCGAGCTSRRCIVSASRSGAVVWLKMHNKAVWRGFRDSAGLRPRAA